MARFFAVLKFKTYTHQALCDYAIGITTALTGSLVFVAPPVSLADMTTLTDAMQSAIIAWGPVTNRGSRAQHSALIDARKLVENMIRTTSTYINAIADGDLTTVLSSGMMANEPRNPLGVLPAPANFRSPYSKHTSSGQTRLRWNKVKGADSYNIYAAATPTDPFVLVGTTTKTLWINNGVAGRLGYWTIRCVGSSGLGVETSPLAAHSSF